MSVCLDLYTTPLPPPSLSERLKWWKKSHFSKTREPIPLSPLAQALVANFAREKRVPEQADGSVTLPRGRLVKDSKSGKPKMTCRNWECGVVLPVPSQPSSTDDDLDALFSSAVPVPMVNPGRAYGPNEEPWFYTSAR